MQLRGVYSKPVTELRNLWENLAERIGLDIEEEAARLGIVKDTFYTSLTRGFSKRHEHDLKRLCERLNVPYERNIWLQSSAKKERTHQEQMFWVGSPTLSTQDFYDQLREHYSSAVRYRCLRVGGVYSKNRTRFQFDIDGLAFEPIEPSIRVPYLNLFWTRLVARNLSGYSVHVVRTIDRLVELWASLELLRSKNRQDSNAVYLAPVLPQDRVERTVMGVRVIDGTRILLSIPAPVHGSSRYSSWIDSPRLAEFGTQYIEHLKLEGCEDLTRETPVGLTRIMEDAFSTLLVSTSPRAGNYGILNSFARATEIKDRMLGWVDKKLWFPVIG